jgi:signal transduction histidine kinase
VQNSARDLQQKLHLIQSLQSELATLYTFRQNLLESMQEGLAVFDAVGEMEFYNPFWERFCLKQGWNPAVGLADFGHLLGHPQWSNLGQQMSEGGLPPESEVYLRGGFWQVRGLLLASEGSVGSRWMVVVSDLTARHERDRARAEALRFVTHELRTPLVSIQGFAEFLMRYPKAADSTEAAATIFRESQRLVSLINTYLDVLRFDAGAKSLRKEPVAISEMVAQVEMIMAPIADSSEIRVRIELDSVLPALRGDRPMLTGVLLNLLNNAVKYSPRGSEVALAVHSDQTSVIFEVSNPGSPIAPEDLAHLFEPFYRAHEHETSKPGWGLGLTFVKRIVEEHHGAIKATSDEHGIRVRVSIPADDGSH